MKLFRFLVSFVFCVSMLTISLPLVSVEAKSYNETIVSESTLNRIVSYAKKQTGIKFLYGGTSSKGYDASGFVKDVFSKNKVNLPRTTKDMYKQGANVSKENVKVGDLVFFDTKNSRKKEPTFVGIYLGNHKFIAVTIRNGVEELNMKDNYWNKRYIGAKRVVSVTKTEKLANVFSLSTIKVGDKVVGMRVESVLIPNEDAKNLPTRVLFEGETTITGKFSVTNNTISFLPDNVSLMKLPVLETKSAVPILTFDDQEATRKLTGNITNKQNATITIDKYGIHYVGEDIWITAELNGVKK
ncbi:C40 family peptidase [Fredinandcohnia humi]